MMNQKFTNAIHQLLFIGGNLTFVRGKKVKAGGQTKNKAGDPPGGKFGMKCYDGQRVAAGSVLLTQVSPFTFPGWNVRKHRS